MTSLGSIYIKLASTREKLGALYVKLAESGMSYPTLNANGSWTHAPTGKPLPGQNASSFPTPTSLTGRTNPQWAPGMSSRSGALRQGSKTFNNPFNTQSMNSWIRGAAQADYDRFARTTQNQNQQLRSATDAYRVARTGNTQKNTPQEVSDRAAEIRATRTARADRQAAQQAGRQAQQESQRGAWEQARQRREAAAQQERQQYRDDLEARFPKVTQKTPDYDPITPSSAGDRVYSPEWHDPKPIRQLPTVQRGGEIGHPQAGVPARGVVPVRAGYGVGPARFF